MEQDAPERYMVDADGRMTRATITGQVFVHVADYEALAAEFVDERRQAHESLTGHRYMCQQVDQALGVFDHQGDSWHLSVVMEIERRQEETAAMKAERDTLLAEIEASNRTDGDYEGAAQSWRDLYREAEGAIVALRAQVEQLYEALEYYGAHPADECDGEPCTCGLDDFFDASSEQP